MNISGPTTVNAYHNTVMLNASGTGPNFGSTAMSVAGPPILTMQNNILVNTSLAMGTGNSVAFRKPTVATTYSALSNNNLFYGTAVFSDNTTTDVTLDAFKNRLGDRDMSSVSENPSFLCVVGSDAN